MEYNIKQRTYQRNRLSNSITRFEYNIKQRKYQHKRLSNPTTRINHNIQQKKSQNKRLSNPIARMQHNIRQIKSQNKRLLNPIARIQHNIRQIKSQSKRLSKTIERIKHNMRQAQRQKIRLLSNTSRIIHNIKQIASQKKRLSNEINRIEHNIKQRESQQNRLSFIDKRLQHQLRLKKSQMIRLNNIHSRQKHRKKLIINQKKRLKNKDFLQQHQEANKRSYYQRIEKLKKEQRKKLFSLYRETIKEGPIHECVCCCRLWFKESVSYVIKTDNMDLIFLKKVCPKIIDNVNIGYLCTTCLKDIRKNKIPTLSCSEELQFPVIPQELLELSVLEERFICPRIPFMQIRERKGYEQYYVVGRIVNVPTDVDTSTNILPRTESETAVVPIALKRKKKYISNYIFETVRPKKILNALLKIEKCPLFEYAKIKIDYNRVKNIIVSIYISLLYIRIIQSIYFNFYQ